MMMTTITMTTITTMMIMMLIMAAVTGMITLTMIMDRDMMTTMKALQVIFAVSALLSSYCHHWQTSCVCNIVLRGMRHQSVNYSRIL